MTRALSGFIALSVLLTVGAARADEADVCASAAENAQSLRDKGKLKEAREGFLRCARDTCPAVVSKDCGPWLDDMDKRLPSVVLHAHDAQGNDLVDVTVLANGAPLSTRLDGSAVTLNPGETLLHFSAPGLVAIDQRVVIGEGERARGISVVLSKVGETKTGPKSSNTALKVVPWVMVGVSVASLATFGILQGVARSELSKVEDGCGKTKACTDKDLNPIRTKFVGSGVGLGLSIASLAVASGIWIFTPRASNKSTPAISVTPSYGGATLGARWPLDF